MPSKINDLEKRLFFMKIQSAKQDKQDGFVSE